MEITPDTQQMYTDRLTDMIMGDTTVINSMSSVDEDLINFALFIFYISDRLQIMNAFIPHEGKEKDYYEKVLAIEEGLSNSYMAIGKMHLFNMAVDAFASVTAKA